MESALNIAENFREWMVAHSSWPMAGDYNAVGQLAKLIEADRAAILAEAAESRWISVKERLPEQYTAVLVTNNDGECQDERDPEIASIQDNGKWNYIAPWNFNLYAEAIVTHWMPLPDRAAILAEAAERVIALRHKRYANPMKELDDQYIAAITGKGGQE